MQHAPVTTTYVAGSLIGFTCGLAITAVLCALVVRASHLPGKRRPNALLVLCALAWNTGGLARAISLAVSPAGVSESLTIAGAVQFTGAAVWPVALLGLWRSFAAQRRWQRQTARVLFAVAIADAAVIVLARWLATLADVRVAPPIVVKELTSFNGCLLALGAIASLARRPSSRAVWFSLGATLTGAATTAVGILLVNAFDLPVAVQAGIIVASEQSTLIILIGGFCLFAEFRFADLFIRQSLRIVAVAGMATVLVILWRIVAASPSGGFVGMPGALRLYVL